MAKKSGEHERRTNASGTTFATYENRLINEKSPYLLQHAHNPVDWYPWGDEAFEKAKREDKPIFLSIGYSTCHWCHVMEEESFSDAETGRLLNEVFVCIKVDREERPDIDNIYMRVCQLITGGGGWPLTIIMTPDRKPFFAGTYIPKAARQGMVGLADLTNRIHQIWTTRRKEVVESADQITDVVRRGVPSKSTELSREDLDLAYEELSKTFDERFGGFGDSMKFPIAHTLSFLLRYWRRTGISRALEMVERTLTAMREGGLYDQLGFGFHRYTTDREWRIPLFEKMLYDQAMISMAYVEAYQATGNDVYAETVREIIRYVQEKLTSPGGGFFSGQDADTEGEEGKFYLWTHAEVQKVLSKSKADFACSVFDIQEEGNYVDPHSGIRNGENILHLAKPVAELARDMKLSEGIVVKHIQEVREKLYEARERRPRPYTDDKILTDWNGLMIAALARAGRALGEPKYVTAAEKAFKFVLHHLRTADGLLLHRFRDNEAGVWGMLEDYAFFAWGALELYEATFETDYLEIALRLSDEMITRFWDEKQGGFFQTSADEKDLIVRSKDVYDGAIPSGNSVAAMNLLRLHRMTGNADLEDKALGAIRLVTNMVRKAPSGYTQLLVAGDFAVGPSQEVIIAGDSKARDTREMIQALHSKFLPNTVVILRPTEDESPPIVRLAKYTEHFKPLNSHATAYVCRYFSCQPPTQDVEKMLAVLEAAAEAN